MVVNVDPLSKADLPVEVLKLNREGKLIFSLDSSILNKVKRAVLERFVVLETFILQLIVIRSI